MHSSVIHPHLPHNVRSPLMAYSCTSTPWFIDQQALIRQIIKPLWPFLIASAITIYGVARIQDAALASESLFSAPHRPSVFFLF